MSEHGVYAGDLEVGATVLWDAQTWRVTRAVRCGADEVELVLVVDGSDRQLVLNMHAGQIVAVTV